MIKLVRANHLAQAFFFIIILKFYRKIACDFSSPNQYSHDVDVNGKPLGLFDLVDFAILKAKESSRMAQHTRRLICSRFFTLYNIIELREQGSKLIMDY